MRKRKPSQVPKELGQSSLRMKLQAQTRFLRGPRPISEPLPHPVTPEPAASARCQVQARTSWWGLRLPGRALTASSTPQPQGDLRAISVEAVDHASDSSLTPPLPLLPSTPLSDQHLCPPGTLSRSLAVIHALSPLPSHPQLNLHSLLFFSLLNLPIHSLHCMPPGGSSLLEKHSCFLGGLSISVLTLFVLRAAQSSSKSGNQISSLPALCSQDKDLYKVTRFRVIGALPVTPAPFAPRSSYL